MPRVSWPLLHSRPRVQLILPLPGGNQQLIRNLLADTGAGVDKSPFDILLTQSDCLSLGGRPFSTVMLGRAYTGLRPVYMIRVQVPGLGFDHRLRAVGVTSPPNGFEGVACFPFLNQFTYGNFGDSTQFGLEC